MGECGNRIDEDVDVVVIVVDDADDVIVDVEGSAARGSGSTLRMMLGRRVRECTS